MATTVSPIDLTGTQIDQAGIDRQRAIAALMQQDSLNMPEGQMISGHYVAPSPTQYISKLAKALIANNMNADLDAKAKALQMQGMHNLMSYLPQDQQPQAITQTPDQLRSAAASQALSEGAANGSNGPTIENAQRMDQIMANQPQSQGMPGSAATMSNPFGVGSLMRSKALAMLGGDPAAQAYWKQFDPTDATKMATAAGVDPRQANAEALRKATYIAPTSLRPGGYVQNPDGTRQQLPNVPEGFQAVSDGRGGWKITPVNGGIGAISASAAAKLAGQNTQTLVPKDLMPTNSNGTVNPITVSQAIGTNSPPATPPQKNYSNSGFPAGTQVPPPSDSGNMDRYTIIKQELDAEKNPTNRAALQREIDRLPFSEKPQGLGAPFGAQANAEAVAKSQVESMQNSYKGLQTVRAGGNMALEDIGKMINLASQKNPLTAGPQLAAFAGIVSPNAAVYEKSRDNLVTNLSNQLGMSTDAAREMVYGSIPPYGAPKSAIADGLKTLQSQVQQRMLKADLLTRAYNAGNAKLYNQLENDFDQTISPKLAGIIAMPPSPARAAALKSAASDPQARQSLEWAVQNGVLK
jgi:hypothetical protein